MADRRFDIVEDEDDAWGFGCKLIDTYKDDEELWADRWYADCPEDLTLDRQIGSLVDIMNDLQDEIERLRADYATELELR